MTHENWRNDRPLLSRAGNKYVNLRKHPNRILRRAKDFDKRWYSYRIVTGFGRTGMVKKRRWANADRTFEHLALGANHKLNALL